MKILLIGDDARVHAIAWKLSESPRVTEIFCAPGNAGTSIFCQNVNIGMTETSKLVHFASANNIDLTVVGHEIALELGIVDEFKDANLAIIGPTADAAQLETSKGFAKELLEENSIPTADSSTFDSAHEAREHLKTIDYPCVVKADGLASGKGVRICHNLMEALQAVDDLMKHKICGNAGESILIEEFLEGDEISVHVFCDHTDTIITPHIRDYKRLLDRNRGPMTGGMGAVGPIKIGKDEEALIHDEIVEAILQAVSEEYPYSGILFPGIILTLNGPEVLEFNCRFGDPETQVLMRLLGTDLLDIFLAIATDTLSELSVKWLKGYSVCVVLASSGYPDPKKVQTGFPITGIDKAEAIPGIKVFHAGTTLKDGRLVTTGGRVLSVTSYAETLDEAIDLVYRAVSCIRFKGKQYRSDIGRSNP